jgi:hypothetical protein
MPFDATISAFAAALVDPALAPPGGARARRFGVYRNNVAVGLTRALEARYPVCRRLVGEAFFRALAGAFIAVHKPANAVLIHYGAQLPEFLRGFAPVADLPYLWEVAALENAWVEAYHAAEAEPLALAALGEVAPEKLDDLRFVAHPAARALRAQHPAAAIWDAHQGEGEPQPPASWAPQDALITRPHADVSVRVLPPRGYAFFAALRDGASLGEAAAPLIEAGDDPGAHLVGLVSAGAFSAFR